MVKAVQNSQTGNNEDAEIDDKIKKDVNSQIHQHLSTIFVVVGIVSFTLGAIVNWYTIQRIKGGKA
jgi:Na+/H+-translocating membrane pyrophosphatase